MPLGPAEKSVLSFGDVCCVHRRGSKDIHTQCIQHRYPILLQRARNPGPSTSIPSWEGNVAMELLHHLSHKLRSPELPSEVLKIHRVPSPQQILRNTTGVFIFISSRLLLHCLISHNSSTPENWGTNFCKLNVILIAVISLKVWLFTSEFASFTLLELLKSQPSCPILKVETL